MSPNKNTFKNILLAPRFIQERGIYRAAATTTLTDFFLDRGFLPFMSFYDTKFRHKEEAVYLARKYLENSHALVLQGGNDICPSTYHQSNQKAKNTTQFRDVFELALLEQALQRRLPILGICRGMQLINIYFGGTLFQHLDDTKWLKHTKNTSIENNQEAILLDKVHKVVVEQDSVLQKWLGKLEIAVNSMHHQGIDRLGLGLQVEARAEDGLIEALSIDEGRVLGVQWHPELDLCDADQRRILDRWLSNLV